MEPPPVSHSTNPPPFCPSLPHLRASATKVAPEVSTQTRLPTCNNPAAIPASDTVSLSHSPPPRPLLSLAIPQVKIDNRADAFATVVEVKYPMEGEDAFLTDVVTAMKNLGLNIVRARLETSKGANTFFVTEAATSDKILKSVKIEEIRLAILDILSRSTPDAGESLSIKAAVNTPEAQSILGMKQVGIATQVKVVDHPSGTHTVCRIITRDR